MRTRLKLFLVIAELADLVKHFLEMFHLFALLRLVLLVVLLEHVLILLPIVLLGGHSGLRSRSTSLAGILWLHLVVTLWVASFAQFLAKKMIHRVQVHLLCEVLQPSILLEVPKLQSNLPFVILHRVARKTIVIFFTLSL